METTISVFLKKEKLHPNQHALYPGWEKTRHSSRLSCHESPQVDVVMNQPI
jgi:hypothetical protein